MQSSKQPAKQPRRDIKKQGPDDAVVQKHKRTPRNVDVDHANQVPDNDWEVGTTAEQLEPKKAR
jgi:hypothetical protein